MLVMKVYEYVVFKDEKRDKDDQVVDAAAVLVPVTLVVAEDDKQVGMMAARAIPEDQVVNLDRIQVVVRPF